MFLVLVSAALSALLGFRIATLFRRGAEQFWGGLAAVALSLGFLANVLSIFTALTPTGWVIAQLGLTILVVGLLRKRRAPGYPVDWPGRPSAGLLVVLVVLVTVLGLSLRQQIAQPVAEGDELNYHASKAGYWLENQSVFPFDTHNDRQTVFAYQGELAFFWPVLLSRSESLGSLVFWLGVPFACAGVYLVARAARATPILSAMLALLFLSAPLVLRCANGLKPEMWLTAFLLGAVWWLLHAVESENLISFAMAGVFCALAISTKFNALALVPVLLLMPWLIRGQRDAKRSAMALGAGLAAGAVLSGCALLLAFNMIREGHPLGASGLRATHTAEISPAQLRTHLARLPILFVDPPGAKSAVLRTAMEDGGKSLLRTLDAEKPLRLERKDGWPGLFTAAPGSPANRFSTAGILAFLVFAIGTLVAAIELARHRRISRFSGALLLGTTLFLAVGFLVRWMTDSELPDRFLIPFVALMLALAPAVLLFPGRTFAAGLLLVWGLSEALPQLWAATGRVVAHPLPQAAIDGPFAEASSRIPAGSKILFLGWQSAPDYGLFAPRQGFSRGVVPWGKHPFSAERLSRLIKERGITHVLIENDQELNFYWVPSLNPQPFLQWLRTQPDVREVTLRPGKVKLFATSLAQKPADEVAPAVLSLSAPEASPLVIVDSALRETVGLEASRLKSPWAVENLPPPEGGYLWMGTGPDEGLGFRVWAKRAQDVLIRVNVSAGPSRSGADRTLHLRRMEDESDNEKAFSGKAEVLFSFKLNAGPNTLTLYSNDAVTLAAVPNGDTRHLVIGLHQVDLGAAK